MGLEAFTAGAPAGGGGEGVQRATSDAHRPALPLGQPLWRERVWDLASERLTSQSAHDGIGEVLAARVVRAGDVAGGCNFIDVVEMPPGTSIGVHRHREDEEEFYLVLSGAGVMSLEDEESPVSTGSLIRNPPGGAHGLRNTGSGVLRLFVFELTVQPKE